MRHLSKTSLILAGVVMASLIPRAGLAQVTEAPAGPPSAYGAAGAPVSSGPRRAASPPVIVEADLPRASLGLWGAGIAVASVGAVGVGVGGVLMQVPGGWRAEPEAALPVLVGGFAGVALGSGMIIAGRDRDYGRPVPRRSLGLATAGAALMTASAGLCAAMSVWPTKDPRLGEVITPESEGQVSKAVTFSVGLGGIALFGGGLVMLLVGSAQAPDAAGLEVASAPALRLELPTLGVSPLYTQRELSRYGLTQGTEVRLDLLRGAF